MNEKQKKDGHFFPHNTGYHVSVTRSRFDWVELKPMILQFGSIRQVAEVLDLSYDFIYNYLRANKSALKWYRSFRKALTVAKRRSRQRLAAQKRSNLTSGEIRLIHLAALECARVSQLEMKRKRRADFIEDMAKDDPLFAQALRDLEGSEIA